MNTQKDTRIYGLRRLTIIIALAVLVLLSGLFYIISRGYAIEQAERRVQDVMLESRGFHHYVQRNMHPALYDLKTEGRIPDEFYAPELLSSSYITRNFQKYFNEERLKAGMPEIRYKMASKNPRNPVNQADSAELELIKKFASDSSLTEYSEIFEQNDEEYLLYARPFLRVDQGCLRCHGSYESAPVDLREIYKWKGGFGYEVGEIVAAEIIRSPLKHEFGVTYTSTAIFSGFLILFVVLGLGRFRLKQLIRKHTRSIRESKENLELALKGAELGMWSMNVEDKSLTVDEGWKNILGYAGDNVPKTTEELKKIIHPDDFEKLQKLLESHLGGKIKSVDAEHRIKHFDGRWLWVLSRGKIFKSDSENFPTKISGTIHDITERKEAQLEIEENLRTKEILLREIHHRVKNNLQVISSLLNLQSRKIEDNKALEAFTDSVSRIKTMSRIHSHLYMSDDYASIDFGRYTRKLVSDLVQSFKGSGGIDIDFEMAEFSAGIDFAIPFGLIINELVCNALLHAFPDNSGGKIRIILKDKGEGNYIFSVSDNGKGLPEDFNPYDTESLGMKILYTLTTQIDGELSHSSGKGTTWELKFNYCPN